MDFRILGPLQVSDNGRRVDLAGAKPRTLLAILLLHPNEVVSAETLIEELWAGAPPATAEKTLRAHVSRLRGALNGRDGTQDLNGGLLETRERGYLLNVRAGELDADRFALGVDEARRALAGGDARDAAESLSRALALWRGAVLADFAYAPFAQDEIARLDQLRLAALEERIEAELELGHHREVVGELEALLASHPLRERLMGQLMLALYRSDRQADALQVYQRGRLALQEQLGIEPGQGLQRLERQILEHDPALAASPAMGRRPVRIAGRPRNRRAVVLAGALIIAAAVAATVLLLTGGDGGDAAAESGVTGYDPETGELLPNIPVGTTPSTVAAGAGAVWALDADDKTISKIDPAKHTVARTFGTASTPTDLAVGAGAVWVGNGFRRPGVHGPFVPESVSRIDPASGRVVATIRLPKERDGSFLQGDAIVQQHIAATQDAIWVINPDLTVSRIDPRTNDVVARVEGVKALTIAAGQGGIWVVDEGVAVAEIDPATNRVGQRIEVATDSLTALVVGDGSVWVANTLGGSVWRIDSEPEPLLHEIRLELGVRGLAFGGGAVWATNEIAGKLYRIDPDTNRPRTVSRIAAPRGVAFSAGTTWTTTGGASSGNALPAAACGGVYASGAGSPQLLLVSNLPLNGTWSPSTRPMVDAIRFVLERRDFKAGSYSVGYQSCDESTAQAHGFEFYRCYSNARAYARKPEVIGVIGAHSSFCSYFQIPIANQAPDGPLAMISPTNTFTGLTRPHRGMHPGELEDLYPIGERNYVRISAADHLQAVAEAELAKQLGSRRLFVLAYDDDPYLAGFAANVRTAARNLGLELAGSAAWNPDAGEYRTLAREISEARADAVFIGGHLQPNGGRLVRDLRARLGPEVALIATDYFWTIPDLLAAAGPAARGMYVSILGVPNSQLAPRGKRFLAAFEAGRDGDPSPSFSAAYAAQATEIMLDAIARSDGTRRSVTRALRRITVKDGLIGDIRFDDNGDLLEAPITILRVTGSRRPGSLVPPQDQGAVLDRVITARASRLR